MTIHNVSNAAQLTAALENATGGDEIRLAEGDYGDFSFSNKDFSSELVITSANDSNPAVFSQMTFSNVSNLTIDNVFVDFIPDASTKDHSAGLKVTNSSNISVLNSTFEGGPSVTDGEYIGRGMSFLNSDGLTISNNEVSHFRRGILTSSADDVTISYNYVHDNRTSTLSGGDVSNLIIVGNHLSSSHPVNFGGAGDHGDFIHYWTLPGQDGASTNIAIQDNFIEQGNGTALLGIYLDNNRNPQGFENVLIDNNVIHNGNGQGIRLEDVNGAEVSNNTLVQTEGDYHNAPRIRLEDGTVNVVLENNIVSNDTAGAAMNDTSGNNITETGTLVVQYDNPHAPNYVGDLFTNGLVKDGDVDDFQTVNGTAAQGLGADLTSDQIAGGNNHSGSNGGGTGGNTGSGGGDTGNTGGDTGNTGGDTGNTGGDTGNTGGDTGNSGGDTGNSGGNTGGGGDHDTGDAMPVIDDFVLDFAALDGTSSLKGDAEIVSSAIGEVLHLDGHKDFVKLGRLEDFEDSQEISFAIDFERAEADGSEARLVWNHKKFGLTLEDDGFVLQVATADEGFKKFHVDGIGLNDTDLHSAVVILNAETDRLQVIIDDTLILDETGTDLDFVGAGGREWGWSIGTGWNRYFDGDVSDFRVEADADFVDGVTPVVHDGLLLG